MTFKLAKHTLYTCIIHYLELNDAPINQINTLHEYINYKHTLLQTVHRDLLNVFCELNQNVSSIQTSQQQS